TATAIPKTTRAGPSTTIRSARRTRPTCATSKRSTAVTGMGKIKDEAGTSKTGRLRSRSWETTTMATDYKRARAKPRLEPESFEAEPTWEIARLFPPQGMWSEEEFFALPDNHWIEFADGRLD